MEDMSGQSGVLFWGPYMRDPSILGPYWVPLIVGSIPRRHSTALKLCSGDHLPATERGAFALRETPPGREGPGRNNRFRAYLELVCPGVLEGPITQIQRY